MAHGMVGPSVPSHRTVGKRQLLGDAANFVHLLESANRYLRLKVRRRGGRG